MDRRKRVVTQKDIQRAKEWKLLNPEKVKAGAARYRRSVDRKYVHLKHQSKIKGFPFTMTKEEFVEWFNKQVMFCHYCDVPIEICNPIKKLQLTFDRKDNSKYYTTDNMVLACNRCNAVKTDDIPYHLMKLIGNLIKMVRIKPPEHPEDFPTEPGSYRPW